MIRSGAEPIVVLRAIANHVEKGWDDFNNPWTDQDTVDAIRRVADSLEEKLRMDGLEKALEEA